MKKNLVRASLHIKRIPITYLSEKGYAKSGGYMAFGKPLEDAPTVLQISKGKKHHHVKVLWCPYCGEWTLYEKESTLSPTGKKMYANGEGARFICKSCSWAHTDEFYVKTANKIWGDTKLR